MRHERWAIDGHPLGPSTGIDRIRRGIVQGLMRTQTVVVINVACSPQRRGCDGVRIHSCPPRAGQYNRPVTPCQGNLLTQAAGATKRKTSWLGHGQSQNVFTIISSRVVLTREPLYKNSKPAASATVHWEGENWKAGMRRKIGRLLTYILTLYNTLCTTQQMLSDLHGYQSSE